MKAVSVVAEYTLIVEPLDIWLPWVVLRGQLVMPGEIHSKRRFTAFGTSKTLSVNELMRSKQKFLKKGGDPKHENTTGKTAFLEDRVGASNL